MQDIFLKTLRGEPHARPPVWLMRQAGRCLPPFRALRQQTELNTLFRTPELIAQVTCLPVEWFGVDVAILFSDILMVLDLLGIAWNMVEGTGPVIAHPIRSVAQLEAQRLEKALEFVQEAIQLILPRIEVPLLGFSGGPFTLVSYLIEGKGDRELAQTKQWMYSDPDEFRRLLDLLTTAILSHLKLQVTAGVSALQLFESHAHLISETLFCDFVLPCLKRIVEEVKRWGIPLIVFCRGTSVVLPYLTELNPVAIGVDWQCDLTKLRARVPSSIALQGNIDPHLLCASQDVIAREVHRLSEGMRGDRRFIFNLGHGVLPHTPWENVKFFVDNVRAWHADPS